MTDINHVDIPYTPTVDASRPNNPVSVSVTKHTGLSAFVMKLLNKAVEIEVKGEGNLTQKICVNKRSLAKQILRAEGIDEKNITEEIKKLAANTIISDQSSLSETNKMTNNNLKKFVSQLNKIRESVIEKVRKEIKQKPREEIRPSLFDLGGVIGQVAMERYPVIEDKDRPDNAGLLWSIQDDNTVNVQLPIEGWAMNRIFMRTLTKEARQKYDELVLKMKKEGTKEAVFKLDVAQAKKSEPYHRALLDDMLERANKKSKDDGTAFYIKCMKDIEKGDVSALPKEIKVCLDRAVEKEIKARKKQIDQMVDAEAAKEFP